MAKISIGMSFTIDYVNKLVQFAKIDGRIDDIDLDADIDGQLQNFDKAIDKASKKLSGFLKEKVKSSLIKKDE